MGRAHKGHGLPLFEKGKHSLEEDPIAAFDNCGSPARKTCGQGKKPVEISGPISLYVLLRVAFPVFSVCEKKDDSFKGKTFQNLDLFLDGFGRSAGRV